MFVIYLTFKFRYPTYSKPLLLRGDHIDKQVVGNIAILHQIMLFDFLRKIMFYSKISGKMGQLLKLIYQCLVDITQFTFIFMCFIILFSFEYQLLGMGMVN